MSYLMMIVARLLPLSTVIKLVIRLLEYLASKTETKLDDEMVSTIKANLERK